MLKKTNSKTARTPKKQGPNATRQKTRQGATPFHVGDPLAMLRKYPAETEETIREIAADKKIHRRALPNTLHQQLAYRLALLGLVDVDTLARNAKNRVYSKNQKTTPRALKAVLSE